MRRSNEIRIKENKINNIIKSYIYSFVGIFLTFILFSLDIVGAMKDSDSLDGSLSIQRNIEDESYKKIYPIKVRDHANREIVINEPAKKIVSAYYISSALLIALDLEDEVIGLEMKTKTRELYKRSAPRFLRLPEIGNGRGINIEEVAKLSPDLVVLPLRLKETADILGKLGINSVVVNPESQEELLETVEMLGKVTGKEDKSTEIIEFYQEKLLKLEKKLSKIEDKPKVYIGGPGSYLTTTTSKMYQDKMMDIAGGVMVSKDLKDNYWANISKEQLMAWNPDYIFKVEYGRYDKNEIKLNHDLKEIEAVKNEYVLDFPSKLEPWDYPTPSSVLGILWLAHTLHPRYYERDEFIKDAREFYKKFFNLEVSLEEIGIN